MYVSPSNIRGKSRQRESLMSGSVRGARGNSRPYRDRLSDFAHAVSASIGAVAHPCMRTVKRKLRSGRKLLVPRAPTELLSRAHQHHPLSSGRFFVRPGAVSSSRPARCSDAPVAAAVKAGRRGAVTTPSEIARPRLDGSAHGARLCAVGGEARATSSATPLNRDWAVNNMRKAPHNLVSGRADSPEPKSFMHG
jgi:hypothetical protein